MSSKLSGFGGIFHFKICIFANFFKNITYMKPLKIGDLIARIPIIQGGMGVGISLSGLASAVANEGGVGVISSAGLGLIYRIRHSALLSQLSRASKSSSARLVRRQTVSSA